MKHEEQKQIRNNAIKDIKSGMSIVDVARKYDRTRGWCYDIIKDNKLETEGRSSLNYNTYRIIAELFDVNQTVYTIGEKYSISFSRVATIYRNCVEAGIPVPARKPGTKPKIIKETKKSKELGSDYFITDAPSFQEEIQSMNRRIRTRKR